MVFLWPKLKHYEIKHNKPELLYLQDRRTTDGTVRWGKNRWIRQNESNNKSNLNDSNKEYLHDMFNEIED